MLVRIPVRIVGAASVAVIAVLLGQASALAQALPKTSPVDRMQTPVHAPVAVPSQTSVPLDANRAPETPVAISQVVIEGATVFPVADLDALTSGLVGKATRLRQVEDARLAMVKLYRNGGYPLVAVDADLKAGVLRFVVSEGRIAEVRVEGEIGPARDQVAAFLQHLTEERPVSAMRMERWILLAQDVPGVTVQTILSPSEVERGALVLTARVRRQAISASISADNRAYKLSGPEEMLMSVGLNSFTSYGERTEVSLFRAMFQPAEIFGQASIESFIGSSGLKLRVYGGSGDSTPRGDLALAGYEGTTTVFGATLSYPVIKQRKQVLNADATIDGNDAEVMTGQPAARSSYDAVRAVRLGGDYVLADMVFGTSFPAVNFVTTHISHGIVGFGASNNGQVYSGRSGSKYDFTKMAAELSRDQTLFQPWDSASITLYGLAAGQYSADVLPPSEQFLQGGTRFTRGFYAGEVTGDNALALTAELRLNTRFAFNAFGQAIDAATQFYGFYDWGETWQNQSVDPSYRLSSYGLGVRMNLSERAEFGLEGVRRETRVVNSSSTLKPLPASALYWRVVVRY